MKKSHIIALLLIAVAVSSMFMMVDDYSTYETFQSARTEEGMEFHVVGELVKEKPLHYNPEQNANYFTFYMKDNNDEVRKVVYKNSKPQDFERSEQIVLTGKMEGEEFQASKILMKCPSKYIETEIGNSEVVEIYTDEY